MWHIKQSGDRGKEYAKKVIEADQLQRQQESHKIGRLLSLLSAAPGPPLYFIRLRVRLRLKARPQGLQV